MGDEGTRLPNRDEDAAAEQGEPFESKLEEGRGRFLAELMEEVLATGEQTAEDFIRRFPPALIMKSLADEPELRARILCPTTGIKERLALKKTAESAGVDLELALEEEVATPDLILEHFGEDDRIRFLSNEALWALLTENPFWLESEAPMEQLVELNERHRHGLVAFVLAKALRHGLLTHDQIVNPIMFGDVSNTFQSEHLMEVVRKALEIEAPFTPELFLETIPLGELVEHVSTKDVWEVIVVPEIAVKQGFASASGQTSQPPDAGWDPASLAEGVISESDPPEVVSEDVRGDDTLLADDDVEDVAGGDKTDAAESIEAAVAQATAESRDGPDTEVTVEEGEAFVSEDELMDADDEDDATAVVESPFDDAPQIENGAFERARNAAKRDSTPSSSGSMSSNADLVTASVIKRLRNAGYKLVGVTNAAALKDVVIRALKEVNPKEYSGRRLFDLKREKTSVLAKSLVLDLRKTKGDELAGAVLEDLQSIGAASVVTPNPDPKVRKPPRYSGSTSKKK